MAQQMHVEMVDDIDPTHTADTTVHFSLDGQHYEIDLANTNADKLRDTLAPWIAAARKASPKLSRRISSSKDESQAIREWAQSTGVTVSKRGRISADVIALYRNRNSTSNRQKVEEAFTLKRQAMAAAQAAKAAEAATAEVSE